MPRFAPRLTNVVLTLGICFTAAPTAWAQNDSLQAVPEGRLVRIEEGFSLELAGGFELGKQQDGYYLLGSRTIAGLILVKAMPGLTAAGLSRNLRSGYSDPTVQLARQGPVTELAFPEGFGKLAEVEGALMGGEVQGLLAGYLRSAGGGLLLFAVTAPEQWPELRHVAEQIARSVRLFVPDPNELIRLWSERLAGFKLIESSGASEGRAQTDRAKIYYLCGDGTFLYHEVDSQASAEIPGADAAVPTKGGDWEVVPRQLRSDLVFRFPNGNSHSYRLGRDGEETYLDNQRYFVLPNERCQ